MAHKDKNTREVRVYLRDSTIKTVKHMALALSRDDWHMVMDDMIRVGVAYSNEVAELELTDWDPTLRVERLKDVPLRVLKLQLLEPKERD